MTDYLASKAEREESKSSVAKGDTDGWTTVSRRSIRGRPANSTDENSTVGRTTGENKLLDTNQYANKTQHKYDTTTKRQTGEFSHVKILKRNSNASINVIKPTPHHEEGKRKDENLPPQKTAGILRIPDIHVLVDEGTKRWKEFNTGKEIWPSIDAKEDENGAPHCSVKSYSSILRAAPQMNAPSLVTDNKIIQVDSHSESEEEQVGSEAQKKKKKAKKKKKKTSPEEERRTEKPVTIDFGSILDMKQSSFKTNQSDTSTATSNKSNTASIITKAAPKKLLLTSTPLVPSLTANKPLSKGKVTVAHMPHNILDSSAPLVKRGKERETPAKKRPSALKKVILKEREEKKRQRELGDPILDNMVGQLNNMSMADGAHDEEATQVSSGSHDPLHEQLPGEDVIEQFSVQAILPSQKPKQLHNRKFREYCDHMLSPEIDNCVTNLLSDLHRFQTRAYLKDPIKARAKRRYVLGLREVTKHLRLKRIKCVIASPNLERIQSTGGIDEMLMHIIQLCNDYNVTMVYALNRKKMGGILRKKVPVSIVGVFSYDGAEQHYKKMVQLVSEKRELYRDKLQLLLQSITTTPHDDPVQQETEEYEDSPCSDNAPCDGEGEQFEYDDNDSWDQSMFLHTNDIIQGSCDPLQGGYYYIPAYYHQSSSTHLNIDAPEFVPSWKYS